MKHKLKKVATFLLCIVIFVSSAAGIVTLVIDNMLDPSGKLGLSAADPAYNAMMYETVTAELEKKMALVTITMDDISDILNEDEISRAAPEVAVILTKRLLGVTDKEWRYENEDLRVRIGDRLNVYAEANGIEYKDGSADEVYNMICDTVSDELNVMSQNYVEKVSPTVLRVRNICSYWMLPITVFFISFAGVIFINMHHVKRAVYNALLPSYISVLTVFALSAIIYGQDYMAKTVLGNGTLQYYLRSVYNSILSELKQVSGVFAMLYLLTAGLIIAAIIVDHRNKKKKKHRHRPRHDKNKPLKRRIVTMRPRALPEELSVDEIVKINEEFLGDDYPIESAEDLAKDFYVESEDDDLDEDIDISAEED